MRKVPIALLLAVILAFFLRFIWLDKIPIGISNDELDYILNAKAVFLTGKDISGTWFPFSLTAPPYETPKGEIPYAIIAPFIGITNFSLFAARFPYAMISVLFVIVMYFIVQKLLGRPQAVIAAFALAINPWSIWFGRTAYDTPFTIFFYYLALYIILVVKGWKIFLAFPFLFIAFFSYVGTKIIFLPFVAIILFFSWYVLHNKRFTKQYLVLFLLCLGIFIYYLISLQVRNLPTRIGDLISPNSSKIVNLVDMERRLSIATPLTNVFSNKLVVFTREAFSMYVGAFAINLLFLHGEQTAFISLWDQGFFYYLDLIFVLLGFYFLFVKNRKVWLFLVALILIAPLPSVASTVGSSYAIRSSLLFPPLIIFISVGIWNTLIQIKNKNYRFVVMGVLCFGYGLLLVNFYNNYFFRHPLYNSDKFNFSQRIVAKYIDFAEKKGKEVVIIEKANNELRSSYLFKNYLFYTNSYNKSTAQEVANVIKSGSSTYKHIKFLSCEQFIPSQDTIVITNDSCKNLKIKLQSLSIARLSDGGEIYKIYDNYICNKYLLHRYPSGLKLADFAIESLSEKEFCEKFITILL